MAECGVAVVSHKTEDPDRRPGLRRAHRVAGPEGINLTG